MKSKKLIVFFLTITLIYSFLIDLPDVNASTVIQFKEDRNPGFKIWENVESGNWAYSTYLVTGEYQTFPLDDDRYKSGQIGIIAITHDKPTRYPDPETGQMKPIGPKDTLRLTKVEPRYHDGFRSSQVEIFNNNPSPDKVSIRIGDIKFHNTGMHMEQLNLHNKGKIISEDRFDGAALGGGAGGCIHPRNKD